MLTREEALAIYQAGPQTVVRVFLEMDARIHALEQRVEELQAQVQPLQDQLAQNSRNSSKPPSSDGLHKPSPQSLRQKGRRQSGGQPGHKGHTLQRVEKPDRTEVHRLDACECCGRPLGDQPPEQVEKRQVHDLPPQAEGGHRASGRNQTLLLRPPEPRGLPRRGQRPGAIRSLRPGRGRLFEQLSVPAL